jgi:hypothetical protein
MSKQKARKRDQIEIESWHQLTAGHVGAWALTGLAMLGSLEMILQHQHSSNPAAGKSSTAVYEQVSRAEGKGESARLPEEFDIGLQTTSVSGL